MELHRHRHLSSEFEEELTELRSKLLLMASTVEAMIGAVINALVERDSTTAEGVVRRDKEIDQLEKEVDELCIRILALRQPAATDLRRITTVLKVVTDLERMGDLCVNIAKAAMKINREPQIRPYVDIPHMATMVKEMVRHSLDSFVTEDTDLATKTICDDKNVDAVNDQVFRELVNGMIGKPATIDVSTRLIFVARHLERIADHATNIAEQVIFMVMGDDVRHEKAKLRAAFQALERRGAECPGDDDADGSASGPPPIKN